jgi:hypothetical protein
MGGKRGISRKGKRLAVVLTLTVLGTIGLSGIALAAPSQAACSGRTSAVCVPQTHNSRSTTTITEETSSVAPVSAPVDSPATVSAPKVSKASTKAPSALKASVGAKSAVRADHKKDEDEDKEGDAEGGEHGNDGCSEDDIGDEPDGDDDQEDCVEETAPPEEICSDGIDNNSNGEVDEDCETPEPPEPPAPPAPPAPPKPINKPPVVLPRQIDRLPTTGVDATSLFLIGLTLVAIGGATRIRTSPLRAVFAGQGSAAELILVQYLNHVATQRTIRRRRT